MFSVRQSFTISHVICLKLNPKPTQTLLIFFYRAPKWPVHENDRLIAEC